MNILLQYCLFIYLFVYLFIYIFTLAYCFDIILAKYHEIFQN